MSTKGESDETTSVMPTSAYMHVNSLPAAVSGTMSPYPTVVLVLCRAARAHTARARTLEVRRRRA